MGLTFTTFSTPHIRDAEGDVIGLPEKALVAIAYLLTCSPKRTSRTALAEFLWGENEQGDRLANLRQLLARTREKQDKAGFSLLVTQHQDVILQVENLRCDLTELPAGSAGDPVAALDAYRRLMVGEFLAGCRMTSANSMLWLEAERSRQSAMFSRTLQAVMDLGKPADHGALLRDAANRLLAIDPYNETAYRVLHDLHMQAGEHSQARILTRHFHERLKTDLGLVPETVTRRNASAVATAAEPVPHELSPTRLERHGLPRLLLLPPRALEGYDNRLALGLLEDVTIGLCRARSVSVVAPHTARRIASAEEGLAQVYSSYNVSYALETKLVSRGDAVMLYATLADVGGDNLAWAERFDVSAGQLSRSYRNIVQRIVSTATEQIERLEFRKIDIAATPDAYQQYLLGQHHLKKIDLPNLRRARKLFRSAIHQAPTLSNAFSGLSRAEHLEWLVTARGDRDLLRSAERHAQEAIDADAANAGGYHQLGVVKLYNSAFDESLEVFAEAEQIAPSHADLVADYADTLVHASEPDRALEKIECAIDLNPLCPDVYWWTAAGANYCLERFETALACIDRMDDSSATTRLAAACWGMLGDQRKARSLVRRTMEIYPDFEIEKWLAIMPVKEGWQKEQYREGLRKAGFK